MTELSFSLAVLVQLQIAGHEADSKRSATEFQSLAASAGINTVAFIFGSRQTPHPKWFVGSGKLSEIEAALDHESAQLVLINHELSPTQQRNLEQALGCRVVDRVGLILDIFAQRARTYEGKLQVELAQLNHLSTRLIRGWTHLERQKGGIGLRGPGETQLETDRRLIRHRIKSLKKKLVKVKQQRGLGRAARKQANIPVVALVGYTNAGKSTLFGKLTASNVEGEDQLFATLDPVLRKMQLKYAGEVILADTVGFVSDLPHTLIEAFNATLEEVVTADLIVHVINAAHPDCLNQANQVLAVLADIGAGDVPCLSVFNKVDQVDPASSGLTTDLHLLQHQVTEKKGPIMAVSALMGEGLETLKSILSDHFLGTFHHLHIIIPPEFDAFRAFLYQKGVVKCCLGAAEKQLLTTIQVLKQRGDEPARGSQLDSQAFTYGTCLEVVCGELDWSRWLQRFNVTTFNMSMIEVIRGEQ